MAILYGFSPCCLSGVVFLHGVKIALVIPFYKGNEKKRFSNYRPIVVLPCFSKVLEKMLCKRVLNFQNKHKILTDSQYGLREKRSTNLAILELFQRYVRQWKSMNIQWGFS